MSEQNTNPDPQVITIKNIIKYLIKDGREHLIIEFLKNMHDLCPNIIKAVLDDDMFVRIIDNQKVGSYDLKDLSAFLTIGRDINPNFMKNTKLMNNMLNLTSSNQAQEFVRCFIRFCIDHNKDQFIEVVKSMPITHNWVLILDELWKKHNKSIDNNFPDLIDFVNSGARITTSSTMFSDSSKISVAINYVPVTFPYTVGVSTGVAIANGSNNTIVEGGV
jgi:hypothetical protein